MPDPFRLRVHPLDLPLQRPFTISRGSRRLAQNVLVEVESEGVLGRGEGAPNARYAQSQQSAIDALRRFQPPHTAGPFEIEDVLAAFRDEHPAQDAAACALEIALWDWIGQKLQQPVFELLSIDPRQSPASSWTISIDAPEAILERLEEARSWPILKVKLAGGAQDLKTIEQLRAHTDRPLRVDANEAWDFDEAVEKIPWLADQGCELVEQPLPSGRLEEMARLKALSPLPLIADEDLPGMSELAQLAKGYHGVNVKLSKCGGITSAVRMIHAARQNGLDVMLGCFIESSVGISAAAQIAGLARWADLDGAALLARDPFRGATVCDGQIRPGSGTGLGISLTDST